MSSTLTLVVLIAAACGAVAFLTMKVIIPAAELITDAKRMLPFLRYLPILEEIQAQFGTDSGASIKDAMNRVERSLEEARAMTKELAAGNRTSITELQSAMGTVKELAREDRELARRDRQQMFSMVESLARTEASGVRVEAAGAVVAEDLKASQQRADAAHDADSPGTAADEASRSPDEP